jgi:hypothetical protein
MKLFTKTFAETKIFYENCSKKENFCKTKNFFVETRKNKNFPQKKYREILQKIAHLCLIFAFSENEKTFSFQT